MMNGNVIEAPILVGVDGSDSALDAVQWAAVEAHRRQARLRLVMAFGDGPTDLPTDPVGWDYHEELRLCAHEQVARAAKLAGQVAPDVKVIGEVLPDQPVSRLATESRTAQLLVVGNRGFGGLAGLVIGSVAVALVATAACPVVVVRGAGSDGPVPTNGPVVVGVDASPAADTALGFAFEAAERRKVPVVAVHAWHNPVLLVPDAAALIDWTAVATAGARLLNEQRLQGWIDRFPDVEVEKVAIKDSAARALVTCSAEAQLVVVGSRGLGNVAGRVHGSVSHSVLHHARCPVAVTRSGVDGDARPRPGSR
jgi:nucleotide-binding universal stress UspA family protein